MSPLPILSFQSCSFSTQQPDEAFLKFNPDPITLRLKGFRSLPDELGITSQAFSRAAEPCTLCPLPADSFSALPLAHYRSDSRGALLLHKTPNFPQGLQGPCPPCSLYQGHSSHADPPFTLQISAEMPCGLKWVFPILFSFSTFCFHGTHPHQNAEAHPCPCF